MAKQFNELSDATKTFITQQKLFFVATAAADGRINLSPKGMDSFRIIDNHRIAWLNVTGSGNESAAHVKELPRMTIMFMALTGDPLILRLYGTAKAVHREDAAWQDLYPLFTPLPGTRQIFDLTIDMVQTSCGMAVPYYDYVGEREQLNNWATKIGDDGIKSYWEKKNQTSIDGKPTGIFENLSIENSISENNDSKK